MPRSDVGEQDFRPLLLLSIAAANAKRRYQAHLARVGVERIAEQLAGELGPIAADERARNMVAGLIDGIDPVPMVIADALSPRAFTTQGYDRIPARRRATLAVGCIVAWYWARREARTALDAEQVA